MQPLESYILFCHFYSTTNIFIDLKLCTVQGQEPDSIQLASVGFACSIYDCRVICPLTSDPQILQCSWPSRK